MKIKPEHYKVIVQALREVRQRAPNYTPELYEKIQARDPGRFKDAAKAFRWDALYRACISSPANDRHEETTNPSTWVCDNIYPYANDDHIDTALKAAVKEVWG